MSPYGIELKACQNAVHTTRICIRRNDISDSVIDLVERLCDPVIGLNIHSKFPLWIITVPDQDQLFLF